MSHGLDTNYRQLFERSQLAQETGAAIHLAPNCHGLLRRFGVYPESFGANPVEGVSERKQSIGSPLSANYYKITEYTPDGTLKFDINVAKPNAMWQHVSLLLRRRKKGIVGLISHSTALGPLSSRWPTRRAQESSNCRKRLWDASNPAYIQPSRGCRCFYRNRGLGKRRHVFRRLGHWGRRSQREFHTLHHSSSRSS